MDRRAGTDQRSHGDGRRSPQAAAREEDADGVARVTLLWYNLSVGQVSACPTNWHLDGEIMIRKMKQEDIQECADLFIETFSAAPWYDVYENREEVVCYFNNFMNNNYFVGYVFRRE